MRSSQRWLFMLWSFVLWCQLVLHKDTDVSEEHTTSIFRVKTYSWGCFLPTFPISLSPTSCLSNRLSYNLYNIHIFQSSHFNPEGRSKMFLRNFFVILIEGYTVSLLRRPQSEVNFNLVGLKNELDIVECLVLLSLVFVERNGGSLISFVAMW